MEVQPVALKQFGLHVGNYANRIGVVNYENFMGPCRVYNGGGPISAPSAKVIEENLVVAQMVIIPNHAPAIKSYAIDF